MWYKILYTSITTRFGKIASFGTILRVQIEIVTKCFSLLFWQLIVDVHHFNCIHIFAACHFTFNTTLYQYIFFNLSIAVITPEILVKKFFVTKKFRYLLMSLNKSCYICIYIRWKLLLLSKVNSKSWLECRFAKENR